MAAQDVPDQNSFCALPKLPDGWHYEQHSASVEVVHIVWPGNGAMSVNFKQRTFAAGWCRPGTPELAEAPRGGRGWKKKLVGDAVARFQSILEEMSVSCRR